MPEERPKWYSPFVLLVGIILSFADPVTDIITVVEFYRADHKIWFGVGLGFVFVHSVVVSSLVCFSFNEELLLSLFFIFFSPFFCFFVRLDELVVCLKRLWNRNVEDADENDGDENADDQLSGTQVAVIVESLLESAPQFVLQLYVASVQEEPLEVIQILSIPVSFLSLVWTFTTTDTIIFEEIATTWKVKHRIALLVTHLLLVSSRLLAICYFAVSYKWLVIVVFLVHGLVITTVDSICDHKQEGGHCSFSRGIRSVFYFFIHWLRDDITVYYQFQASKQLLWKRQLFSSCLYISENVTIILLFYFSQQSHTWYSLPVTICVCLFSVLGAGMRIITFRRFYSKIGVILENNNNDSAGQPTFEANPRFGDGGAGKLSAASRPFLVEAYNPSESIYFRPPPPVPHRDF